MSSSLGAGPGAALQTEPFQYPVAGDGKHGASSGQGDGLPWSTANGGQHSQAQRAEREAYERGLREGEARGRSSLEAQWNAARSGISTAIHQFDSERETYFGKIEPEVVHLALAIARKILHREAQIDPLLLTGMVHVALEKLDSSTRVRLRANPADIRHWSEFFLQQNGASSVPELIGDPNLQLGECALETEVGSTHVSLDTQLKEIEQGFLDLLEQRPRVR